MRAVGGFYDVQSDEGAVVRCRARGRFKKEGTTIHAGDRVRFTFLSETEGVLEEVKPRESFLVRPPVANVDQVMIVCAPQDPPLSLQLLDRLLVLAESQRLRSVICMNKDDLPHDKESALRDLYGGAGYTVLFTSALYGQGIEDAKQQLCKRITVLAGPSGVGKSSLLNRIQPGLQLKTAEISEKSKRGRHTTRHVELLTLDCGGLVADSPGFSQLDLSGVASEELPFFFPEFQDFSPQCRFKSCKHYNEPDCAVKDALERGEIASSRYNNYLVFLEEVMAQERSY
ncbi:ribosome small subunit-dependent GTPase A [Dethiobacter alkaliphilus]|uniref:ribosome small subunit-dependent GTPase A n=1 Tax=Dethiobacter alkaliphilus TaxID=427926 RepID=UPI0029621CF9|nr:ribosome small subunit-dependent GTPase A [Dethiobacter alkaliphilus]